MLETPNISYGLPSSAANGSALEQVQSFRAHISVLHPNPDTSLLWKACHKMGPEQLRLLGDGKVSEAIARIVDTQESYPALTQFSRKHPSLLQARVLLQMKAGTVTRKYNKERLLSSHSECVADEFITRYKRYFKTSPTVESVHVALWHDMIEDFYVTAGSLCAFSSKGIAQDVRKVTTPKDYVLKRAFRHVPGSMTKMARKNLFKAIHIPRYDLSKTLLKLCDNLNVAQSFWEDIRVGRILMTTDKDKVDHEAYPPVLYKEALQENLNYRQALNGLMLARCIELQLEASTLRQAQGFAHMINEFRHEFDLVSEGFREEVEKRTSLPPRPEKPHTLPFHSLPHAGTESYGAAPA